MKRVAIFIDGCNFFYGLKSVNKKYTDYRFDFLKFCKGLVKKDRIMVAVYYYNAPLKNQINPELYRKQQKLFSRLRKEPNFKVILCKRQSQIKGDGKVIFNVKGDDIHLAIDMLKHAYENTYDTAILVSGDGDFVPVVKYVKRLGKEVENVHFRKSISYSLSKACNKSQAISKKGIKRRFYNPCNVHPKS